MKTRASVLWTLTILLGTACCPPAHGAEPRPVRIGVADTLFGDVPKPVARASRVLLQSLIRAQTGLDSKFVSTSSAEELAEKLDKKQIDMAIFHGIEFAWTRCELRELEPIVIAVKHSADLHAHLLVRKEAAFRDIEELCGRDLGIPVSCRPHCKLYLEKLCAGKRPDKVFRKVIRQETAEDALDDLVDNLVQCALVDEAAYDQFRKRKPARFARLRELCRSELFPAAVVAVRPGALTDKQIERFRKGMMAASDSAYGQQILTLFRARGFSGIPENYERTLNDIVKAYPRKKRKIIAAPAVNPLDSSISAP